jgi:hypothetical protein
MTKTQFRSLYSEYRKAQFNFESYMSERNFPCGHDDMLYERFEASTQEWLEKHPELKNIIDGIYDWDFLQERVQSFNAFGSRPKSLKIELRRKYPKIA